MISITTTNDIKTIDFPKLMSTKNGYLAFFSEEGKGLCLKKPQNASDVIGAFSIKWVMDGFEDYNGSVTISNTK